MYERIFKEIQRLILQNTIHIVPNLRGKILKSCVIDIVKFVRLERARAKRELSESLEKEIEDYSINIEDKKMINIEDVKYLADKLQRDTFLLRKESPVGKI